MRYLQSHALSRFPRLFHAQEKGHEESDYFHFLYICTCLLSTKIKAVKSFPPLKVWNFAVYGHVHVHICMVCHKETKKTRANVVFVCIFYTFFCFSFFNLLFFFVFLKFQISKICLHLITYHTN